MTFGQPYWPGTGLAEIVWPGTPQRYAGEPESEITYSQDDIDLILDDLAKLREVVEALVGMNESLIEAVQLIGRAFSDDGR